jgi:hypothetical protein
MMLVFATPVKGKKPPNPQGFRRKNTPLKKGCCKVTERVVECFLSVVEIPAPTPKKKGCKIPPCKVLERVLGSSDRVDGRHAPLKIKTLQP